jgi:serine/threonine protein kinase
MLVTIQGTNGQYTFNPQDDTAMLGQGGMGIVFKGSLVGSNEPVAIKVLYKEITSNLSAIERERQSAGIRIDNRNLIKMLDFAEQNGIYHIVSELVEGKTLHNYMQELQEQKKRIEPSAALKVINQVMDGLMALHNNQPPVIHRDIDPSNIMLCPDGTAKIMDFGIARISDGKRKSLTGMGTVIGKPHYSPPEQIRGESDKINQTTDIYALGITIYEILTGNPPFNATNEYDVMKMQIEKPLPYHPNIPMPVFRVIQKATEKKQEKRYATVRDFRNELNAAFQHQAPASQKTADPQPKSRLMKWLPLALIAALGLGWAWEKNSGMKLRDKYQNLLSNAMPITITDIKIGNSTDGLNNVFGLGETLYSSKLRYLCPQLIFTTNTSSSKKVLLFLKYYSEKGTLISNSGFKNFSALYDNYSTVNVITIDPSDNNKLLYGFGNGNYSIYNPGNYRIEVWAGNVFLFEKSFTIEPGYR